MKAMARGRSILRRPLRTWGPVLALLLVVVVSVAIAAVGLRSSPTSPSRAVLVTSGDWAPFVGPQLRDGGPVTKLVVSALNRSGYSPEIRYTSWALAEEQVTSGASNGVFPLVGSASRQSELLVSDPLIDFEYVLFFDRRVGEPSITSAADLSRLRVGGIAGYDYWSELEAAVASFVPFDTALKGFQALAAGQIDVLAEGLLSGEAVLSGPSFTGDAGDFGHIKGDNPLVHSVQALHFMMAKTDEAAVVMGRFNRALAQLRQTDEYALLVKGLQTAAADEVSLIPYGDTGLVELLDANGGLVLLAPHGTRARVLRWPPELVDAAGTPPARILVEVKISNGPAQGRVCFVDARALELEAAES